MQRLEVGKPFRKDVTVYEEGTHFDFTQAGASLVLFFYSPTTAEINACKAGPLKIGFLETDNLIWLLFKFGNLSWMDAPYTVHLSQPFIFESLKEGSGYALHVCLVDANTGLVKALRLVGLGTEWSNKFKDAVLRQKEQPFDEQAYDIALQRVYRVYPTEKLVELALDCTDNFFELRC